MKASKRLGQHFLISPSVALFMVRAAGVSREDSVLEIGPGKGVITRFLARRAGKVYAIEKDRRMAPYLKNLPENVELIWGDALKVQWPRVNKLVSNLPFYISSRLLFRLPENLELAVLGLQKEFAEKMVAEPGSEKYGRLSVSARLLFEIELLKSFPPTVFRPAPKVWLSVVRLRPKKRPENWKELEEFIRGIFSYPNRKVDNALKLAGYPPVGEGRRVKELGPEEVAELFDRCLTEV